MAEFTEKLKGKINKPSPARVFASKQHITSIQFKRVQNITSTNNNIKKKKSIYASKIYEYDHIFAYTETNIPFKLNQKKRKKFII